MKLIILDEDGFPIFNPEARMIREFKVIIERDKGSKGDASGRFKKLSTKELAYVHFMTHYNSEFVTSYAESERPTRVIKHLDLPDGWKADATLEMAMITYKELITTPSMNSLIEAREALFSADKLLKIYRKKLEVLLQSMEKEATGAFDLLPEDKAISENKVLEESDKIYAKIMDISKKMPDALDTIAKLEERVKKEMQLEGKGRKGQAVNDFEL